ncbi:RecQ family ATP-dependent DNA helicase [Pseudomonas sp.]|uniref:RecQ family ATP-dependent DNA helicase n=1 Tax=Pseudomonas sp. TaxID=306 RepID=UPI003FD8FADB
MDSSPPLKALIFDLEAVPPTDNQAARIIKLGALRPDTGETLELNTSRNLVDALAQLDQLSEGATWVLGHNVIDHDLPLLKTNAPGLALHDLGVIDTLRLSPLAFPRNPYHRLIKDYKLIRESLNSPLADCHSTLTLFQDQKAAFAQLWTADPKELRCYQSLVAPSGSDLEAVFFDATQLPPLARNELSIAIQDLLRESDPMYERDLKVCRTRLTKLLDHDLSDSEMHWPVAYALAWLRVSGGNSVLAPWVRYQFPAVTQLIAELRDVPCGNSDCQYCNTTHNPRSELKRYFGFPDFRYEKDGESLQYEVVLAGMRGENVLAILATGGGKSLCYQLPALNRYHRNGSLTVIVSPLQSLMKDQVDGLLERNVQCAASLNGMLTMPERANVLEKIQMGDVGILLVSPEQFRNKAFRSAIKQRQIGAWIFDEAHCLSKWGNDFRPDYLYASRFIREYHSGQPYAPIGCFTATAKPDVLADIRAHFKDGLGITFQEFLGSHERNNLSFSVLPCTRAEKWPRVHHLLDDNLGSREGGAVIFVSSRKSAEELSEFLVGQSWPCKHFHAGLAPNEKADIQDDFKSGKLRVIVATNAFGMGVDKSDIRLVVHADIPGSLENYLQEAGRAGRDQDDAQCVLLYDPQDIETQFGLSERSKLSLRDIQQILRKLRFESSKRKGGELVITAGEILMDASVETSFAAEDRDAETKVTTAVAWLERSEYLKREENQTRIFPARPGLTAQEAEQRLVKANLPDRRLAEFKAILTFIYEAGADERINTDQLIALTAQSHEEVAGILKQMEQMGLLINDSQLTLYVRHGIAGSSMQRLGQTLSLEKALFELLPELAPDAEQGGWQDLNLTPLTTGLRIATGQKDLLPLHVLKLLRSLAQDRDGESQQRSSFELQPINRDYLKIHISGGYTWAKIEAFGKKRRVIASKIMDFLIDRLAPGARSKDLLIETTFGQLVGVIEGDLELSQLIPTPQRRNAVEHVLLYLHQQEVIILNHGMTVMRRAMTIEVNAEKKGSYLKDDYLRLDEHYREKCIQVHVMREYAEHGLKEMAHALRLVFDYFSQSKRDFIQTHFPGREDVLKLATSEDSWKSIVHALSASQRLVVADNDDQNRLVLAGPGSGKTRVIVHRIAYLLRVRRVPASSIIALAFNRHAATEIRRRLLTLVGADAYGVSVMTYHGMSMRLTGTRFERGEVVDEEKLKLVIESAVRLLEEGGKGDGDDDLCEQLLRGYRYIMVDEYQDIDEMQYRLVSALSGRNAEEDGQLCILAVGDDDQNIYDFRDTNDRYIEKFCEEYGARISYLVENYRSSSNIINASNSVIGVNPDRLKLEHPIRIDKARVELPTGGHWEVRDPQRQGRVLRIQLPSSDRKMGNLQAQAVAQEMRRLIDLEDEPGWNNCAVLARNHAYLKPLRAWCELNDVPYFLAADKETGLQVMRQRGFVRVVNALRICELPLTPSSALHMLTPHLMDEHWAIFFDTAFMHLTVEVGDCQLSGRAVVDWLYEYARELRHQPRKGLYLGTVHSAKGLEFRHVGLLDSGWLDSPQKINDERRLYYVGMTRAEETLTLCEFSSGNPFSRQVSGAVLKSNFVGEHDARLDKGYKQLSLKEIDLSYAGREHPDSGIHAAIADLRPNDPLFLKPDHERFLILDGQGREVGRTSKAFTPGIDIEQCQVAGILVRYTEDNGEEYRAGMKVDTWEVVVPRISGRSL